MILSVQKGTIVRTLGRKRREMDGNSFGTRSTLLVDGSEYTIHRLDVLAERFPHIADWPFAVLVLLENVLRNEDGVTVRATDVERMLTWDPSDTEGTPTLFVPARVLLQDFTGVPTTVDLASMRSTLAAGGGDPALISPRLPADLVMDHSVMVDVAGTDDAARRNLEIEYDRNRERYRFLRWGARTFDNFRVVPPGKGIVHQVNVEHLASVVMTSNGQAYPDTLVGLDSHTTMVNGLGVLGWGVGGIEAEAAMLGQPVSMLIPRVVGFKLSGAIPAGVTATDVVLTITQMLRAHGVVGKFVEFYGAGVAAVPLANRATIGNMSPEFGSTAAMFPIDSVTLDYLRLTGRSAENIALVEAYSKAQGLWHNPDIEPRYSEYMELDLSTVVPSIAGPRRPQDRIELDHAQDQFHKDLEGFLSAESSQESVPVRMGDSEFSLTNGAVTIAAITSCTNTSNPSVMLAAGLLARNAARKGLTSKPWVKTTLAPGSKVVTDYYEKAGLMDDLEALGFYLVGYGCTTCIGNSGPLADEISHAVNEHDLAVTAVLSGNRNFEGRINPDVKMNYLASPPLVIAYALAGTMDFNFDTEALGQDTEGKDVFLADIWPEASEVQATIDSSIDTEMFTSQYASVFDGDERWRSLPTPVGDTFEWDADSTYVRKPPYFEGMQKKPQPVKDIEHARVLAVLGDSVTTDHISPAGSIKADSPAGRYLSEHGIERLDFNSYGSRRGNHEVMIRGTFANIRLKNLLVDGVQGGFTRDFTSPEGPQVAIYDAAQSYAEHGIALVILAGKEYGSGSSRDWAAKGTSLLGVRAVIAESFERIHRSNLIGMGVIPLQFAAGVTAASLGLDGTEEFRIDGITALNDGAVPATLSVTATPTAHSAQGRAPIVFDALVRIDTPAEADYYRNGGILQYVLRSLL